MATQDRREFRIVFEGGELPDELVERIDKAIHEAVLKEIAATEVTATRWRHEPLIGGIGGNPIGLHLVAEG